MKLIGLLALFLGLHSSVEVSAKPSAEQEKIDAVLALAKSSLSGGKEDKGQVLKNAMTLLSEYEDNERAFTTLTELMAGTQDTAESSDNLEQCFDSSSAEDIFLNYADRHARRVEEIAHDFDCMEREFDASDPEFDPAEAAYVLNKCRLLVLRNVFPKEAIEQYRKKYEDYILAVHTGEIDTSNTKSTDARIRHILQHRGRKRHDIMLPEWLGGEQICGNRRILEILRDEAALGVDMTLYQVGSVIAESGAPAMYWHDDTEYLFSTGSFENSGIAGQDLLPYVATMFIPLLDATIDHGPTEFCLGSSHTTGLPMRPYVMNETLTQEGSPFNEMAKFQFDRDTCPPEHWRVPLVGMGDAVISDYHIIHRGGPNMSPELRAMLYVVYSRGWFRDLGFEDSKEEDSEVSEFDAWAAGVRYAMVDESKVKHVPEAGSTLSSVEGFAGIKEELWDEGSVEFHFTNVNVEGASLFLEGKRISKGIAPKNQLKVTADIGQELSARDKDGKVIKTWNIVSDQGQTILMKDN